MTKDEVIEKIEELKVYEFIDGGEKTDRRIVTTVRKDDVIQLLESYKEETTKPKLNKKCRHIVWEGGVCVRCGYQFPKTTGES